jgi:hypothetical protein
MQLEFIEVQERLYPLTELKTPKVEMALGLVAPSIVCLQGLLKVTSFPGTLQHPSFYHQAD